MEFHILLNIVLHIVWDPITVANKIDDLFCTLKCYKVYLIQALSLLQYWLKLRFLCYGCGERITRNMGWIYKRRSLSYGSSIVYSCFDIMYLLWNCNNTEQGCCMCTLTTCPFEFFTDNMYNNIIFLLLTKIILYFLDTAYNYTTSMRDGISS